MGRFEDTTMGGSAGRFSTTHWSLIRNVHSMDEARRRLVLNQLLGRYWKPVYCYLRRKGYDNDSAKDLTQDFFQEVVLGRDLIGQADRAVGKFRTLLLTALGRYVVDKHRRNTAEKRVPPEGLISLDDRELPGFPADCGQAGPEEVFQYAWASSLLDEVLAQVQDECERDGRAVHWQVFNERVLAPILDGDEPASIPNLCAKYGIERESRASNMVVTVKRCFRRVLEQAIQEHVEREEDVPQELNELIEVLSDAGARSSSGLRFL
jgi:DNA-directed RNA polymerase specialized sigma24 family protein